MSQWLQILQIFAAATLIGIAILLMKDAAIHAIRYIKTRKDNGYGGDRTGP